MLVAVELEDGTLGHGEGAPFPAFNGETQDATLAAIEHARPVALGHGTDDWRRLHALGLPSGSIRGLLALLIFGTTWGLMAPRNAGDPASPNPPWRLD